MIRFLKHRWLFVAIVLAIVTLKVFAQSVILDRLGSAMISSNQWVYFGDQWRSNWGGDVALLTNYTTAIQSSYGASGWDYASIPFGVTSNNLITFHVVASSSDTSDRSALALRTLQTNQQSRRIRAKLVPPVVARELVALQLISLSGDNTTDFSVVTFGRPDSATTYILTQTWATPGAWITNTIATTNIAVFTNLSHPHWWVHADIFSKRTNSASAPEVNAIWR